jgi:hypothetical protein
MSDLLVARTSLFGQSDRDVRFTCSPNILVRAIGQGCPIYLWPEHPCSGNWTGMSNLQEETDYEIDNFFGPI